MRAITETELSLQLPFHNDTWTKPEETVSRCKNINMEFGLKV
jgi:hypothetical protein